MKKVKVVLWIPMSHTTNSELFTLLCACVVYSYKPHVTHNFSLRAEHKTMRHPIFHEKLLRKMVSLMSLLWEFLNDSCGEKLQLHCKCLDIIIVNSINPEFIELRTISWLEFKIQFSKLMSKSDQIIHAWYFNLLVAVTPHSFNSFMHTPETAESNWSVNVTTWYQNLSETL